MIQHANILLVNYGEQEPQDVRGVLESLQHRVVVASGAEAAERLAQDMFDVVVVDLGTNGFDASQLLHTERQANGSPAVVAIVRNRYQSHAMAGKQEESIMVESIQKPPDEPGMRAAIHNALVQKHLKLENAALRKKLDAVAAFEAQSQRLNQRIGELSLLNQLSKDMTAISDLSELLGFLLGKCQEILGSESGSIFLLDKAKSELVLTVAKGPKGESLCGIRQKLGEGISGRVAAERKPLLVTDITKDARFVKKDSDRYDTDSFLCVPLIHANSLIGIINITSKLSLEPFTEDDLRLLSILANQAAGVIESRRYFDELEALNKDLNARVESGTRELAQAKNFNESIVKSLPLALLTFDREFKVTFCNDAAEKLFKLCGEATRRTGLPKLKIRAAGHVWADDLAGVVNSGRQCQFSQATLPTGEGEAELVLRIACSPLRDHRGEILGGMLIAEDITEATQMERRLVVNERLAVVGRLAARVAHELNNPLDGILRFTNLAMRVRGEDDPGRQYLQECRKGLQRMAKIISSLLEFSRSTYFSCEDAQVNSLLGDAVCALDHAINASKVRVVRHFAPNLPSIRSGNMYQAFLNIIKNAVDAMPTGGILEITTENRQGTLVVRIADSGTGMTEEVQKKIFEPFFTTKEPGRGTGLGLAISRDIVEKYQGKISVQSEVGKGTTFTIEIPADRSSATRPST